MSTASSIYVGSVERTVWVKVEGRGTFQNSAGLKEFVKQMVQRGFRDFVVDLKGCELMDSTFMGTLAGVALRLREIGQGQLRAVHVNERNADLLANLGLDQLFTVESDGVGSPEGERLREVVSGPEGESHRAKVVLEAHEALVEAEAANAVKFKDVLEYLRQELHSSDSPEDG